MEDTHTRFMATAYKKWLKRTSLWGMETGFHVVFIQPDMELYIYNGRKAGVIDR